jgi:predicted ATP-grasp superfamily ATP-dependent carboligase
MWSRCAIPIKTNAIHGSELLTALRTIDLPEGTVLIITDEKALLTISERRAELGGKFRVHLPPHPMVMTLQDKARFHEFAIANGLPVPNAVIVRAGADLSSICDLCFPVVIKPTDKWDVYLNGVSRVTIANTLQQTEIICLNILKIVHEAIVQECIEGPDDNIYFCLFYRKDNITKAIFTGRKLISVPPRTGSTGLCSEVPPGALRRTLEDLTEIFLVATDYSGFGGIEYKWDARAERFLIIEPTVGRTDWQEEIATLSGINIPVIGYCEQCNLPVPLSQGIPGVVWQDSYIKRIRAGFGIIPRNALAVDGYWRRYDPVPAIIHYPREVMSLMRGAIKCIGGICGQ